MHKPAPAPHIEALSPYQPGTPFSEGLRKWIRLASNESALGPSLAAMEALLTANRGGLEEMHRYPDSSAYKLIEAIAETHNLDTSRIICAAGSDELIFLLAQTYAGPGKDVLISRYAFPIFAIAARAAGANVITAEDNNRRADIDAMLSHVSDKTSVIFLDNPNNPTGHILTKDEIERLVSNVPPSVLVVLDAAYAEYVDDPGYCPGLHAASGRENVVMLRSFSKIYGLAGLRLGWAYAPEHVIEILHRLRRPFNVSAPAQLAGLAALGDQDFTARAKAHNTKWKDWTEKELEALGLAVMPSAGNFLSFDLPNENSAEDCCRWLRDRRGVLLRPLTAHGLPHSIRITIGQEEQMYAVLAALKDYLKDRA